MALTPPAAGSLLLTGLESHDEAIDYLVARGVEQLTCISLLDCHTALLDAWHAAGKSVDTINLIRLDDRHRGAGREYSSIVRPLELSRFHEIIDFVDADPSDTGADHAVLLAGIRPLLENIGIAQTMATVSTIMDRLAGTHSVVLCTLASTPDAIPAGFSHLVADVREPVLTAGTTKLLQPLSRFAALDTDRVFDLVCPDRRRVLLRTLDRHGRSVRVSTLAGELAQCPITTTMDQSQIQTMLLQVDLPKLDRAGLVVHSRSNRTASIRAEAVQLWPFLDLAERTGGI